jgi:transposase
MDNRHLKLDELELLRRKAVEAVVIHGEKQNRVAKLFGFCLSSMSRYVREYKVQGEASLTYQKRGVKPGTHSKLSVEEITQLKQTIIEKTPDQLGLPHTLWTSKVIGEYVRITFGVQYAPRSLRDLMNRLGFSAQKPIARAYKRDPAKIAAWLTHEYPAIKARACQEGARIYWGDEMGIHSTDNRGRMYSPRGKTPEIKNAGGRFKCNMLAAISPQGFMNWMVFDDHFTSKIFVAFLGRLIRQIKQKIFLILDNHRAHHAKHVQQYVNKHQDKIALFFLPPYCPELNPQELVNHDVKANANHFQVIRSLEDLKTNVRYYLTKIQFNEFKIRNFFKKKEVAYAAN